MQSWLVSRRLRHRGAGSAASTACACSSGALAAILAGLAWTLLRPADGRGDPPRAWSRMFLDHRRRPLGRAPLHGGAHRPGAPRAGHGGTARPAVAAPRRVGVGQLPRLVPAGRRAASWWRPSGQRLDGELADASSCACLRWVVPGMLLGAVGPLGPRVLLFPVELLSRQELLAQVIEWQAPTFDTTSQRAVLVQLVLAIVLLARRPVVPVGAARRRVQRRRPAGRPQPRRRLARHAARSWPPA